MVFDPGLAALMRDDLCDETGITETRMFGGICFLKHGNMVCGVHKTGGLYRVGPESVPAAVAMGGAAPMTMTGRTMRAFIDVTPEALADDTRRIAWRDMALALVATLPPKG